MFKFRSSEVRSRGGGGGGGAQLTGGDEKKQDDRGENINMEYVE